MAIGHEAELQRIGHAREHVFERLARDVDARLAIDLRPHRSRRIEEDDGAVGGDRRQRKHDCGEQAAKQAKQMMHGVLVG